jgi:hypothetical protein
MSIDVRLIRESLWQALDLELSTTGPTSFFAVEKLPASRSIIMPTKTSSRSSSFASPPVVASAAAAPHARVVCFLLSFLLQPF